MNLPCLLCKKMLKALFGLAKYLTWWFIKPLVATCVALLCCKSHTHAANIKFQPNTCFSCFKQCFPFLLGYTLVHILVYDKYSPARWVSRKLRPKSKTIFRVIPLVASSRLVCCSPIQCPRFCNVTPDLYRETVTRQTLRWPNGLARMANHNDERPILFQLKYSLPFSLFLFMWRLESTTTKSLLRL